MKKHGLPDSIVDDLMRLVPWSSDYDGLELEEAISYLVRREKIRRGEPDPLTGLPGHLALTQGSLLTQNMGGRDFKPSITFSGLVVDVRAMATFNERFGREAGNELLQGMASILVDLRQDAISIRAVSDAFASCTIAGLPDREILAWRTGFIERFNELVTRVSAGRDLLPGAPESHSPVRATVAALRLTVVRPHSWHILGPLLFEEGDRAYIVERSGSTGIQDRRIDLDGLP